MNDYTEPSRRGAYVSDRTLAQRAHYVFLDVSLVEVMDNGMVHVVDNGRDRYVSQRALRRAARAR